MTDPTAQDAARQAAAMSNEQLQQNIEELSDFLDHPRTCPGFCIDWEDAAWHIREAFRRELSRRRQHG